MNKIAVLTSGGDAPGMNAAIRAVVRTGCENGVKVLGIRRGYAGLMEGDMYEMNIRSVSDIIHRGGTMLHSARSKKFCTEEGMQEAIKICKDNGIEGIVVIGGDGSFRGAAALSARGIPCIGIPGTIDNDIGCCEYTIGYDTDTGIMRTFLKYQNLPALTSSEMVVKALSRIFDCRSSTSLSNLCS